MMVVLEYNCLMTLGWLSISVYHYRVYSVG
jgi:hypothetical protein